MCYSISSSLSAQLKRAKQYGNENHISEIQEEIDSLNDFYFISGYAHPNILIYRNRSPFKPTVASWGLVPEWVKDAPGMENIRKKTLNARSESLFEKPSFKDYIKYQRCVIYVDGFFEYYHKDGKTFPHFIRMAEDKPMPLAGLWNKWVNPNDASKVHCTFSIITTKPNALLESIHNNPKRNEPRMPVILNDEMAEHWIDQDIEEFTETDAKQFFSPFDKNQMQAYPVGKLTGKESIGNSPDATKSFNYPELNTLF